ncbi:ATPase, T2SS/T4P/T4SS family [Telmatospirillum siberiense]|uniref:ATPase, T2SS/T4P/T4SS family n=1 Tax=Telmatospirillum siberiense TaxID=382514 RepID=UPI0013040732|nr:ATPase, T2SS/T4P/T4SS family [Telmatospirillum siberiense]
MDGSKDILEHAWCDLWIITTPLGAQGRLKMTPAAPLQEIAYGGMVIDLHRRLMAERHERQSFLVEWNGTACRVKWFRSGRFNDNETFVVRRLPSKVPDFTTLDYPPPVASRLIDCGRGQGGMVMFTGRVASGKTCSASALFCHWLKVFEAGGVTIEDPPELPMEGQWGGGYCWQRDLPENRLGEGVMDAMRMGMRYIYVGEIRTRDAAREAIAAAATGHMVVCCLHAGDIVDAIHRLMLLANAGADGESDAMASMIAEGLRAVVHLNPTFVDDRPPVFQTRVLFHSDNVAALIRSRRLTHLHGEVQSQAARLGRTG